MNSTSEYLKELREALVKSSGVSSDLITRLLDFKYDYAIDCFKSECTSTPDTAQFSRLWILTNCEHYYLYSMSLPKYYRSELQFWNEQPKTIETVVNSEHLLIVYTGAIKIRLTDRFFTGYDFLLICNGIKSRVILVPELYPWLLVAVGSKLAKSFDTVYYDQKHWVILKRANISKYIDSLSNRLRFVAKNYESICAIFECNSLTPLVGDPFDLKLSKNYPSTHKSPVEHTRCEHIRHYKSGKEITVRATTVCAGK